MQFSYSLYLSGCFLFPVCIFLATCLMLFSGMNEFIPLAFHGKLDKSGWVNFILVISFCVFFLSLNGGRLLHGGYHLIYERETDAVKLCGTISDMKNLSRFEFPELDTDYDNSKLNGIQFVVDGVKCSAPASGDLSIGDYVEIMYLPKSGYILSIVELPE